MRKLIGIGCIAAVLSGPAFAATYDWNGLAADGDIFNAGNWTVTGSTWTHPFEDPAYLSYYTNEDANDINIGNGDTVQTGTVSANISPGVSTAHITSLNVTGGSTLDVLGTMWVADPENGVLADLNVIGSTLTTGGILDIGNGSLSQVNGTFIDSTIVVGDDLKVGNHDGVTATLLIQNSTIDVLDTFYMNDAGTGDDGPSYSQVTMDSGLVTVAGNSYINDDASDAEAYFTLNGGIWNSGGSIDVSWNLDALSHLTLNGGDMAAGGALRLGVSGGSDTGQSRVFLQGGSLQANDIEFNMTDSQIIFTSGSLGVTSSNVTAAAMQNLIDTGKIDVSGAAGYSIYSTADMTFLVPEPGTLAMVILGTLLIVARRRRG